VRNLCTLNPGSDGIWGWSWSITASGNRAVPVSWSTWSFISISN
jgi:hypothetical protein